jgi:hypothetical protein
MPLPAPIVKNCPALLSEACLNAGTISTQRSIRSGCGYTVTISTKMLNPVPGNNYHPYGYSYHLHFSYAMGVRGINRCYNGGIGFLPQSICNSHNKRYYTINLPAPALRAACNSVSNSGTLTASTNPHSSAAGCATVTPTSMGCNQMQNKIYVSVPATRRAVVQHFKVLKD